jgi:quercetin dioxygenase-like cupin family protein
MQSYRLGTTVAMDRSVRIVRPDKVQAYEPGGHAKTENRRLLKTDQVEIILGRMTRGGAAQGHVHKATDQIVFILDGTGSVMKDGKIHEIGPDTLLFLPPGAFHGGEVPLNRTDQLLSFLLIYSPPLDPLDIFPIGDYGAGNSIHFITPDEVTPYQRELEAKTANRRLLRTKNLEISLSQISKGGIVEEHAHALNDQILYVIHGTGSLAIVQELVDMEPGTLAFIPKGVPHGGKVPTNRMDSILKSLVIYTPPLGTLPSFD